MKKLLGSILAFGILFTGVNPTMANDIKNPNADSHVFFYIPHQDDDLLTFGVSILNHLEGGHNVHIVMLTNGANSFVRTRLGMTKDSFSRARNNEFLNAMKALGVDPDNIYFENLEDGATTVDDIKEVITEYELAYPKAKHKAFSPLYGHRDHVNGGLALAELEREGVVSDARYYLQQAYIPPAELRVIKSRYSSSYATRLRKAASFYRIADVNLPLYGIGYKSVPKSFEAFAVQPTSRYHTLLK